MKTRSLAMVTAAGIIAVAALILAIPAMASSMTAPQSVAGQRLALQVQDAPTKRIQLPVGQTISLTSVAGGFREVGDGSINGTASGTLSLTVTGAFAGGYTLAVSGGSFAFNGATYSVSSGSAQLGPYGARMVGQGEAGSAQILFGGRSLGKFGNTGYGILNIDLKGSPNEFVIRLLVIIST